MTFSQQLTALVPLKLARQLTHLARVYYRAKDCDGSKLQKFSDAETEMYIGS